MSLIINFDIYIYKNGKWELSSHLSDINKQEALNEATHFERLSGIPTKLIKETFNPNTGASTETVVYLSDKIRNNERTLFNPDSNQSNDFFLEEDPNKPNIPTPEPVNKTTILHMKIVAIVIGCSIFAAIMSFALMTTIQNMITHSVGRISSSSNIQIFAGSFLITLILTATPLILKSIAKSGTKKQKTSSTSSSTTEQTPDRKSLLELFIDYLLSPADAQKQLDEESFDAYLKKEEAKKECAKEAYNEFIDLEDETEKEEEKEKEKEKKKENNKKDNKIEEKNTEKAKYDNAQQEKDVIFEAKELQELDDEDEIIEKDINVENLFELSNVSPDTIMRQFLKGIIDEIKEEFPKIDSYGRFALNLLLAGGCDTVQTINFMNDETYFKTLKNTIISTGSSDAIANSFYYKLTEYAIVDAQSHLIDVGASVMKKMLEKEDDPFANILPTFRDWYSPLQTNSDFHDIVTVMFTDIIGSTNFTETLGDVTAQQLIRAHNAIVRNALFEYNGDEIKHTGDGIMASFPSATNAVDAASHIQKSIKDFNQNNRGDFPLNVRIGMNSGEPIEEDDDLFGLTVQIASRICNMADNDEIYVSQAVKELSAGNDEIFEDIGIKQLKGVKEAQQIYNIKWQLALQKQEGARQPKGSITINKEGGSITAATTASPQSQEKPPPPETITPKPAFDEFSATIPFSRETAETENTDQPSVEMITPETAPNDQPMSAPDTQENIANKEESQDKGEDKETPKDE